MTTPKILTEILTSCDLPSLPIVAVKLLDLTAQEEVSLAEIADLISMDIALSVKVLRVANSSFYNFPRQITSINQAVSILGANAVRNLVLSFSFLSMKGGKKTHFDFTRFWERSLAGGAAAKLIAEKVPGIDIEELFVGGILQNIGHLVFACTIPNKHEELLGNASDQEEMDEESVENNLIGITHSRAGYEVAKLWGLPELHLDTIRFHHNPADFIGEDEQRTRIIKIVNLSDTLTSIFYASKPELAHKQFRKDAKKLLGFSALMVNEILTQIADEINKSAEYFELSITPAKSVTDILQEANIRLSLIALSYEEMNRELIRSTMQLETMMAELKYKNALLENLSNIDHLTEVANHRYLQDFLGRELNRSTSMAGVVSILMLDIDLFKKINDTFGHPTGDFVLKEFCRITKEIIRDYDLLARYGGEEFIVVLPETTLDDAVIVAEKIRQNTEKHVFCDGRSEIQITISIGVASARPMDDELKKQTFIGYADKALYEAKRSGRNRIVCQQPARRKGWMRF